LILLHVVLIYHSHMFVFPCLWRKK